MDDATPDRLRDPARALPNKGTAAVGDQVGTVRTPAPQRQLGIASFAVDMIRARPL